MWKPNVGFFRTVTVTISTPASFSLQCCSARSVRLMMQETEARQLHKKKTQYRYEMLCNNAIRETPQKTHEKSYTDG